MAPVIEVKLSDVTSEATREKFRVSREEKAKFAGAKVTVMFQEPRLTVQSWGIGLVIPWSVVAECPCGTRKHDNGCISVAM